MQTLAQIVSLLLVTVIHSSLPLFVSNGIVLKSMSNDVTSHDLHCFAQLLPQLLLKIRLRAFVTL